MLDFKPFALAQKAEYDAYLALSGERGCEYSFANLYLWGRQQYAKVGDCLVLFSQFDRKSVYPFPIGAGDIRPALEAVIADAKERGLQCRLTGLTAADCALLERIYPGRVRCHPDRDSFDYIYAIADLAELKGRKFQKKRNHLNHFRTVCPDHTLEPLSEGNLQEAAALLETWYEKQKQLHPLQDYHMEQIAARKALNTLAPLGMEGLLLKNQGQAIALTIGSRLSDDTFDIHFEKAIDGEDGAYAAINWAFARYLREKYPALRWLNREDDMGLEGLRKAKLTYQPERMLEKSWACLLEDGYDY